MRASQSPSCRAPWSSIPYPSSLMYRRAGCKPIPTTSFDSALCLPPLFMRQIRLMIALLDPGYQLQHIVNRKLAQRQDHGQ
jgi:hypothetical protein